MHQFTKESRLRALVFWGKYAKLDNTFRVLPNDAHILNLLLIHPATFHLGLDRYHP